MSRAFRLSALGLEGTGPGRNLRAPGPKGGRHAGIAPKMMRRGGLTGRRGALVSPLRSHWRGCRC